MMNQLLDRRGELRQQQAQIEKWLTSSNARFLPAWKNKFAAYADGSLLTLDLDKSTHVDTRFAPIYLGHHGDVAWFLLPIDQSSVAAHLASLENPNTKNKASVPLSDHQSDRHTTSALPVWQNVRSLAWKLNDLELELILYASGLYQWHRNHQYCPRCGSITQPSHAGHARKCSNDQCTKEHFPRIEPAVIFSVERTNKDNSTDLLLARQASWPTGRYSVLAGFVEHGESLEQAVQREALEETGVTLSSASYLASQPWPFPASLMVAFQTVAKSDDIRLNDGELESAQWFSITEFEQHILSGKLLMPYSISISWQLIKRWYEDQTKNSLSQLIKRSTKN